MQSLRILTGPAAMLAMAFAAAPAQTSGVSIGLGAGFNSTTFGGDDAAQLGFSSQYGTVLGGLVQKDIGKWFFVRTGAWHTHGGARRPNPSNSAQVIVVRLNYVKIPLVVGVTGPAVFDVAPHLMVGIENGMKAGCKHEVTSGSGSQVRDCNNTYVGFSAKSYDFAFTAGAGLNVKMSDISYITINAAASRSRWIVGTDAKAPDLKNRAYSVTVGWMVRERRTSY